MSASSELVSVIIPAYNAADTISETLASVRAQTHRALEIVVVDDGSRDDTYAIARWHASEDARIRVFSQANAGAAAARNRAIAESRGDLIAPIDADDLWRRDKIARQLDTLYRSGRETGLVYTWFAAIDRKGRVTSLRHRPTAEGNVLQKLIRRNIVGNGSSPIIPRKVLQELGGYSAAQPHFCEDYRLYLRIAERYSFAVVQDHLTGYRQRTRSMSNNVLRMLRAHDQVMADFGPRYPQFAQEFHDARGDMIRWLFRKALKAGRLYEAAILCGIAFRTSPRLASRLVLDEAEEWEAGLKLTIGSTFARNAATFLGGAGHYFL